MKLKKIQILDNLYLPKIYAFYVKDLKLLLIIAFR